MKKLSVSILVLFLASLMVGTAGAQIVRYWFTIDVPFSFMVGLRSLPSGHYEVFGSPNHNLIWIKSSDGKTLALTYAVPTTNRESVERSALVFNRYGDDYFLAKVLTAGTSIAAGMTKSQRERELAQAATKSPARILYAKGVPNK